MERNELEVADAVAAIEKELRVLRNRQLSFEDRQRAARMIHNLASVAGGALARAPEAVTPRG